MLSQNRQDKPKAGRKYHIGGTVEVLSVNPDGSLRVKYRNGDIRVTNSDRHDWTDLGPVLEDGYYRDRNANFWYLRDGRYWIAKSIIMGKNEPTFPIQKVTVEDALIDE